MSKKYNLTNNDDILEKIRSAVSEANLAKDNSGLSINFNVFVELSTAYLKSINNSLTKAFVSDMINTLFSISTKSQYSKVNEIVDLVMNNALECLVYNYEPYVNLDIIESANIFLNVIDAMQKLIEYRHERKSLDLFIAKEIFIKVTPEKVGEFIQNNYMNDDFGAKFIIFIKNETAEFTHGSKHAHRNELLDERNEQNLSEVKNDAADGDIPSAPSYSPFYSDDWSDEGRPLKLIPDFSLLEQEALTATPTEECVTPTITEEFQTSIEINFQLLPVEPQKSEAEQNREKIFSPRSDSTQRYFFSSSMKVAPDNSSENTSDAAKTMAIQQKPNFTRTSYFFGGGFSNSTTPKSTNNRKVMPI